MIGKMGLVRYATREAPPLYHERLIVGHVRGSDWVVATPDEDLFIEDIATETNADIVEFNREIDRKADETRTQSQAQGRALLQEIEKKQEVTTGAIGAINTHVAGTATSTWAARSKYSFGT